MVSIRLSGNSAGVSGAAVPVSRWRLLLLRCAKLLLGLLAGFLQGLGGGWPLLGVALAVALLWRARVGFATLVGVMLGVGFWLPYINWLTLYLGPVPWLALCGLMLLFTTLHGTCTAFALRAVDVVSRRFADRAVVRLLLLRAAVLAAVWVLKESAQSSWPYGGFGWGRLPALLVDTNVKRLLPYLGQAGTTWMLVFVVAVTVGALYLVLPAVKKAGSLQFTPAVLSSVPFKAFVAAAVVVCLPALIFQLAPAVPVAKTGSVRVLAVQGNSKSAIFDDRESGAVFATHEKETVRALRQAKSAAWQPDVIVWPENAAEFNASGDLLRLVRLAKLAKGAGAPIVVGSILPDAAGHYFNSSVAISQRGKVLGQVDKRYPVPFGEYMPNREFYHILAPELVDLVQLDYTPGSREPVLQLPTHTGNIVKYGVAICFDITYEEHASRMVRDGAQLILAQTNNADFGRTAQSWQQLQIARVQALVTGRTVVNISTVGTSALVLPDGSLHNQLQTYKRANMRALAPLYTGLTPAQTIGSPLAAVLIGLALFATLGGIIIPGVLKRL